MAERSTKAEPVAGWDHNVHYHDFLLQHLPRRIENALDVGCGHGPFAQKLAARAERVDALDLDPEILRIAASQVVPANLRFIRGDFLTAELPVQHYDAIALIASLHHMPLPDALQRAKNLLRRGGTLLILGLYREESVIDFACALAAMPVNALYRRKSQLTKVLPVGAPLTRAPGTSLNEIRTIAEATLPGAKVRRHLLWRYSLVWRHFPHRSGGYVR